MSCFEIKDPEIDLDEINKIVAQRIEQRWQRAKSQSFDIERWLQSLGSNGVSQEAIHWAIDLMASRQGAILVKPYSASSSSSWLDRLTMWVKKQAHNLVIYYVNGLGQQQILFNESATWAVAVYQARLEGLQEKVAMLEQKLQSLEAQLEAKEAQAHE